MKIKLILFLCLVTSMVKAQQEPLQYYRPNDMRGINVFETSKTDTIPFTGLKVRGWRKFRNGIPGFKKF